MKLLGCALSKMSLQDLGTIIISGVSVYHKGIPYKLYGKDNKKSLTGFLCSNYIPSWFS